MSQPPRFFNIDRTLKKTLKNSFLKINMLQKEQSAPWTTGIIHLGELNTHFHTKNMPGYIWPAAK